jgi:outer membrane murein-binding lipoprotein Lpp
MTKELVERLRQHIVEIEEEGADNARRLAFDDLCAIYSTISSTDGDDGELIGKLLRTSAAVSSLQSEALVNPDGPEAANRISSLNAQLSELAEQLADEIAVRKEAENEADKANARLSEMREALTQARSCLVIASNLPDSQRDKTIPGDIFDTIDAALNLSEGGVSR